MTTDSSLSSPLSIIVFTLLTHALMASTELDLWPLAAQTHVGGLPAPVGSHRSDLKLFPGVGVLTLDRPPLGEIEPSPLGSALVLLVREVAIEDLVLIEITALVVDLELVDLERSRVDHARGVLRGGRGPDGPLGEAEDLGEEILLPNAHRDCHLALAVRGDASALRLAVELDARHLGRAVVVCDELLGGGERAVRAFGESALPCCRQRAGVGAVHHVPLDGHAATQVERQDQHAEQADQGDGHDGQDGPALLGANPHQAPSHRNTALIVGVTVTFFQNGMLIPRGCAHDTCMSWPTSPSKHPSGRDPPPRSWTSAVPCTANGAAAFLTDCWMLHSLVEATAAHRAPSLAAP